jgi:hypothetical protein
VCSTLAGLDIGTDRWRVSAGLVDVWAVAADKRQPLHRAKLAAVPLRHEAASRDQPGQEFDGEPCPQRGRDSYLIINYLRRALLDPADTDMELIAMLADFTLTEIRDLRARGLASPKAPDYAQALAVLMRELGPQAARSGHSAFLGPPHQRNRRTDSRAGSQNETG